MYRFAFRVRYGDTDQMGWVYYANYLRWFEIGRAEMMRSLGRSYRSLEEDVGVLLPVREARARYELGARYDDALVIETGVAERGRASVRFAYRIVREEDGARIAFGETAHFFMGRDGKPMRPPEALTQLFAIAPLADEALLAELARA